MKAIIIDDEPNAIVTLVAMLNGFFDQVKVVASATNAMDGMREIRRHQPDLVFLDVSMPGTDGLDMLEMLETRNFKVVITSGHEQHALRAIRNKVNSYLLKPIDMTELEKIVEELKAEMKHTKVGPRGLVKLVDKQQTVFVRQEEITYIRADGRYSNVICLDKTYVVTKNLGEFEHELDRELFYRVHRSYLINCAQVKNISSNDGGFIILNDGTEIEISRRKKTEFVEFMRK